MVRPGSRNALGRDAFLALAFALWCVAWFAGVASAFDSGPLPIREFATQLPRALVEALFSLSYPMALLAVGLIAFVAMWGLLRLWRWLAPEARSPASLRWALSSRSLNWTAVVVAAAIAGLAMLMGVPDERVVQLGNPAPDLARFIVEWWFPAFIVVTAAVVALGFLCVRNPDTLARDRLERWWRPFWPGLSGLVVGLVCWWLIPAGMEGLWAWLPRAQPTSWWILIVPAMLVGYVIGLASELVAFAFWFARSRPPEVKRMASQLFRWSTLRVAIGFDVFVFACFLVLSAPVSAFAVLKQLDWQVRASGLAAGTREPFLSLTTFFGWLWEIPELGGVLFLGLLLLNAVMQFARGRLLYQCAVPPIPGASTV